MAGLSIQAFFQDLREAETLVKKQMLRFQLELAQGIAWKTQDNIRKIFAQKGGLARSAITRRAMGNTARTSGAGGGLFNSVQVERPAGGAVSVSVGGPGTPYAAVHEYGGVITPKKGKYLTIPFQPRFVGTRAREFNLFFDQDDEWGPVLRLDAYRGDGDDDSIAFLLRRRVRIPARPYLRPAIDETTKDPAVRAMMKRFMGTDRFDIKVE